MGGVCMSIFSNIIKNKRQSKKLSLRSAADLIGISYTYLSNLEKEFDKSTGTTNKPTPETLKMIAEAYELDYVYLLQLWGYVSESELEMPIQIQGLLHICNKLSNKDIETLIEFAKYLLWKNSKET